MKIRLQKFLSQNSICSRRRAEELIKAGLVKINEQIAKLGEKVDDNDKIQVSGKLIKKETTDKIYIMLNKPIGYTCTKRQFKNEKNIYELLPKKYHHLNCVGRLDKNSEGLLILTNDGEYIYKMTHPKFEREKEYEVGVDRKIEPSYLKQLKQGVDIGDEKKETVKAKNTKLLTDKIFSITITQGKKRQIRQMCTAVGLRVVSLKRTREEKIELGELKSKEWKIIDKFKKL